MVRPRETNTLLTAILRTHTIALLLSVFIGTAHPWFTKAGCLLPQPVHQNTEVQVSAGCLVWLSESLPAPRQDAGVWCLCE